MKSILFIQSQTLYAKVTIPVALECLNQGWNVTFQVNRPVVFGRSFGFSKHFIKKNPTAVNIINPESLQFVADLIGLGGEWNKLSKRIKFSLSAIFLTKQFDVVIGSSKNMPILEKIQKKTNALGLGYEHLPVLIDLSKSFDSSASQYYNKSIFCMDNTFSERHKFGDITMGYKTELNTFTFLDVVYDNNKKADNKNLVLIFHPGGYRNIVSSPGDDKQTCYQSQKSFLHDLCIPVIRQNLTPVVKIHPLRARYHDVEDLNIIAREIEVECNIAAGSIQIIGAKSSFWDVANNSAFILTFGSSSIYELWSIGLRNVFVCDFITRERSNNFQFFKSIFINSYQDYIKIVSNSKEWNPVFDESTEEVFQQYSLLFNGNSVNKVITTIASLVK